MLDQLKQSILRVIGLGGSSLDRLFKKGVDLYAAGRYVDAEEAFQSFERAVENLEPSDRASRLGRLAEFMDVAGKYGDAERLYRQVLDLREQAFGPNSAEIAPDLNNLALLNYAQGKYQQGGELFERLVGLLEAHFGNEHRELAICLENYAALLRKMARDQEAKVHSDRAARIRRELKKKA